MKIADIKLIAWAIWGAAQLAVCFLWFLFFYSWEHEQYDEDL